MGEQALRDAIADLRNELLGLANNESNEVKNLMSEGEWPSAAIHHGREDAYRHAASMCTNVLHPGRG